ncbi:MAG: isoprenylcysteine carboxylmethyltransferase family protein [Sedimentisphaerales bacterium]|nr:isoprenylcysteine carboxylmethyltransferase family protein [Sedimentisphaerales bacterium]
MTHGSQTTLQKDGLTVLAGTFLSPFVQLLLLFAAAGTIQIPRAWLYLVLSFVGMFGGIVTVAVCNPELVNERGRWRKHRDTMRGDKLLIVLYGILSFYVTPTVAGLDVGRYRWSSLGVWAAVAGTLLFGLGSILIAWAMRVNPHFEVTVRVQRNRNHQVVSAGPYSMLRHPGYLGAILWAFGTPLIVGSAYGLIPAVIASTAFVVRLVMEERVLLAELPGYAEYARRVRYRLLPYLW